MLGSIIAVFVIAFLCLSAKRIVHSKLFRLITLLPFSLFTFFVFHIPSVHWDKEVFSEHTWIPLLDVSLDLRLDGLSLLFTLLITGIGSLIFLYASYYLKKHPYLHRFYCYLTLFMGAMLGLVLADNVIAVFVFWELTSISSFFLIGFNNEDEESRKSALMALSITGLGGFLLLAGVILMGYVTGTHSIKEMAGMSTLLQNHALFPLMLFLLFGGAFTKSAQFPFHFWLPGAMQAPTPVSAYLHSATMVKAGIYILARFYPVLADGFLWNNTLMIVGGVTMIFGALHSILRIDMKGILAYSTISALGIIVFLLGVGSSYAIHAAVTFILVHALYKATLFLVTGIVDHAAHTRKIDKLGGLIKIMPIVALAAFVAALSSAGVPLSFGFISKDLIYEATLHTPHWAIWVTGIAVVTNILLACSGFMVGIKPFIGKIPKTLQNIHKPGPLLWIPVVILSFFTLLFGLFPSLAEFAVLDIAAKSVMPGVEDMHLKLWHGFNIVLALSAATIVVGTVLFIVKRNSRKVLGELAVYETLSPKNLVLKIGFGIKRFAFAYTRFFQNGYLRNYIMTILLFMIILVGYRLFTTVSLKVNTTGLSDFRLYELTVFALIVVAIVFTVYTSSRLTAIASMGVVGYGICLIFVFYGAPDLAMTQFTIDTLTVVLFVLVLFKLPPFLHYTNRKILVRDALVSLCFGALMSIITLQALVSPAEKEISRFYAEKAYELAKGKNVVNVILVDFRGFDTMIETIVLSIAALGVFSLLKYNAGNEEREY